MFSSKILFVLIYFFNIFCLLEANSRIPFSRPGSMMRIPSVYNSLNPKLFSINASSEILSSKQKNSLISIEFNSKSSYQYGISLIQPIEPKNSVELGFHFQKNILIYGNVILDIGVHDILFRQSGDYGNGLDTKNISLFSVLSTERYWGNYGIVAHFGFGTGKINSDSHIFLTNHEQKINPFLGFQFITPILKKSGGISLISEYDGEGLNVGAIIPLLSTYSFHLGITKFEKFGEFASEDGTGTDYSILSKDAPSITIGITIDIPKIFNKSNNTNIPMGDGIYAKTDSSILYYDPICSEAVETLRDSIRVGNNMIDNLSDYNHMLLHNEVILLDSTRNNLLRKEVDQSKQNKSMRHLSRSLRFFYDENYNEALIEINNSIKENPNLAIAYGRRGSIYYKLGDIRRATLNWNVALQLDPEFTEIYEVLKASEENRLSPIEISKNIGENK